MMAGPARAALRRFPISRTCFLPLARYLQGCRAGRTTLRLRMSVLARMGGVETDVHFRGLLRLALHAQSIGRDTWVLGVAEHQEADDEGEDCQNAIHGVSCTSIAIKAL